MEENHFNTDNLLVIKLPEPEVQVNFENAKFNKAIIYWIAI